VLEVWAPSMPLLAEAALADARLLRLAAALAASPNAGRPFAQALLAFLVDTRLPTLRDAASPARPGCPMLRRPACARRPTGWACLPAWSGGG